MKSGFFVSNSTLQLLLHHNRTEGKESNTPKVLLPISIYFLKSAAKIRTAWYTQKCHPVVPHSFSMVNFTASA